MTDDKDGSERSGAAKRPNVRAENLLSAGKRYGDARVAYDRILQAWNRDDPRDEMDAALAEFRETEGALHRAARAYATRMRRKAPPRAAAPEEG